MAAVGYDYCRNIDLGVPLQPDTHYLYFNFNAGLSVEFGATGDEEDTRPLTLDIPAGASATMILDLMDPFFFINGGLSMPGGDGDGSGDADDGTGTGGSSSTDGDGASGGTEGDDGSESSDDKGEASSGPSFGVGRSLLGNIPFRPETTFGIEDKVDGFDGHRLEMGSFPVGHLPLEISGYVVTRLDPFDVDNGVDPLGFGFGPSFAMGGNGELAVSLSFLELARLGDLLNFGFSLGTATVGMEVFGDHQSAYFSGELAPDLSWVPDFVPIVPAAALRVSGYIGSDLENAELRMEGEYGLNVDGFSNMTGVDFGQPLTITGQMWINNDGFYIEGTTTTDMPFIDFSGAVRVAAFVSVDPEESYLLLEGMVDVGTAQMAGSLEFVSEGILMGGELTAEDLTFGIEGGLIDNEDGVDVLTGELEFPASIQGFFQDELLVISDTVRDELDAAITELEEAAADHEFEVSLRGVRRVLPGVCDGIIRQLNRIPGQVRSRWPSRWGIRLPGRGAAVRAAERQVRPHVNRLAHLRNMCREADAESTRAALRSALTNVLNHRRVRVRVSRLGTVYSRNILSGSQVNQIQAAIAAVDRLPETSSRVIAAQHVVDQVQPREIVHDVADAVEEGISENIPTINSIAFTNIQEGEHQGAWIFEVGVNMGGEASTFTVEIGTGQPLIPSLAEGFTNSLGG
jgi:hypothetical protein